MSILFIGGPFDNERRLTDRPQPYYKAIDHYMEQESVYVLQVCRFGKREVSFYRHESLTIEECCDALFENYKKP